MYILVFMNQLRKYLNQLKRNKTLIELFWSYVEKTDSCWNWKSTIQTEGYGVFSCRFSVGNSRILNAHRVSYMLSGKKLDSKLQIDHICENKACVNPKHLEQVTAKENCMRYQARRITKLKRIIKMTYKEFNKLVTKRIKNGDKKILICKDYDIYPQQLVYYLNKAKKFPNKLVPVDLYKKLTERK